MKRKGTLFAIGVAVAIVVQLAAACANAAAPDDPVTDPYNWGVLFLMAMPYAVAASIAGWLFYSYRRAGAKRGERKNKILPGPR